MIKFRVGALAVCAGLALSACSGMHPGEAAVVDGTSFSMQEVDDLSSSFCVYAVVSQQAQQQGAPGQAVPAGAARQQATKSLIELDIAKKVAGQDGVSVPPSEYTLSEEQITNIRQQFGDAKSAHLEKVVEMLQRTGLLYTAIGAHEQGVDPDSGNPQELATAGQKVVTKAIEDADISVDPRLGLDRDTVAKDVTSGSLSVGVSPFAKAEVSDYAVSQRCS